ncbi:MAG: minor capsid protein [Blautia sp.]|nr:minor capsid protein [Blautia sp.]
MIFSKIRNQKILKMDPRYQIIQKELKSFQELGIKEYTYLGQGNDTCTPCVSLNGKTFCIKDAKVGINLPPMHPKCRCTILAKTKSDLFTYTPGVNPLANNPKFIEWKKRNGG